MSNSVRPHRRQPTRLSRPWDSPGRNTGTGCHFLLQCMKVKSESEVAQSCLTLSNPMDCSLPGSSIHGILQARVLEWGAIAFSVITVQYMLIASYHCLLTKAPSFYPLFDIFDSTIYLSLYCVSINKLLYLQLFSILLSFNLYTRVKQSTHHHITVLRYSESNLMLTLPINVLSYFHI